MEFTKQHYKILKRVNKYSKYGALYCATLGKFDQSYVLELMDNGYIYTNYGHHTVLDTSHPEKTYLDSDAMLRLTRKGKSVVDSLSWFDWQYVVSYILIPIGVGVASALITAVIL